MATVTTGPALAAGRPSPPKKTATPKPGWRRWVSNNERLLLGLSGFLFVVVLWEASVRLKLIKSLFVSSPTEVLATFATSVQQGTFWASVSVSLEEFALGYVAALVLGVAVGLAAGWYRRVNYIAAPWIAAWYATPHIALVPLIILWFGIGLPYKVFYVFLVSFFSIVINTMVGVQTSELRYIEVARSFRASQLTIFRTAVLPGSLPFILTGMRLAAAHAWVGVVVAELIGANAGLGFMINFAGRMLHTGTVMMGVVILGIFGIVLSEGLSRVEKRFDVWRPRVGAGT
jgi:ABC-type nitrate/sulfonate/bicarbonate transport system permease component